MPDPLVLFDRLKQEWPMIAGSPLSFVLAVLIVSTVISLAIRWRYKTLLDQKDEQLKTEQLTNAHFRERLGLLPPVQSRFARITNVELQHEAFAMVEKLRRFLTAATKKYEEISAPYRTIFQSKKPEEEIEKERMVHGQEFDRFFNWFSSEYNTRFRADLALLQAELRLRLANATGLEKVGNIDYEYEHPINLLGLEAVITHLERLERLAKQL